MLVERAKGNRVEREEEALRLRSIAEELANIASSLLNVNQRPESELPTQDSAPDQLDGYTQMSQQDVVLAVELARSLYRSRRTRPRVFDDDALFGEPAWDILLDLFIADSEKKPLSVTSACIGASVPTSTALRWLAILEERGLLWRENDKADARRVFLHLTGEGYAKMVAYFIHLRNDGLLSPGFNRSGISG